MDDLPVADMRSDLLRFLGYDSAEDAMTGAPRKAFDYRRHDPQTH